MLLNDFINMLWYTTNIIIINKIDFVVESKKGDIEAIKNRALFVGENYQLRSDLYKDLRSKYIYSFGVIDNYMIIEVHTF